MYHGPRRGRGEGGGEEEKERRWPRAFLRPAKTTTTTTSSDRKVGEPRGILIGLDVRLAPPCRRPLSLDLRFLLPLSHSLPVWAYRRGYLALWSLMFRCRRSIRMVLYACGDFGLVTSFFLFSLLSLSDPLSLVDAGVFLQLFLDLVPDPTTKCF